MARRKQLPTSILGPRGYTDKTHDKAVEHIVQNELDLRPMDCRRDYHFEPFMKEVRMYFDEHDQMYAVDFVKVYATREVVWEHHAFVDYSKALLFFDAYAGILF